jgi:hypothetical protein
MGLLLIGNKGGGKSMLAEDIGNWGIAKGLPVLMIDSRQNPSVIRMVIQAMGPCIVYFDEFGKIYKDGSEDGQENYRDAMLALFSDTSMTGVMMIVTANSRSELSEFMLDRPGRFAYRINHAGIDESTIREIAANYHLNEEFMEVMLRSNLGENTNYDSLCKLGSIAMQCKTMEELVEICAIANIPPLMWYSYRVLTVRYQGKLASHTLAKITDGLATFKVMDEEMNLLTEVKLQMDGPDALLLRSDNYGYRCGDYMIKSGDLVITYNRYIGPHVDNIIISDISEDEFEGIAGKRRQAVEEGFSHGYTVRRSPRKYNTDVDFAG